MVLCTNQWRTLLKAEMNVGFHKMQILWGWDVDFLGRFFCVFFYYVGKFKRVGFASVRRQENFNWMDSRIFLDLNEIYEPK